MDLQGEQFIPAARDRVWSGLNDPDILKNCIPGCDSLDKTAEDAFEATVAMKVGPVKAKFSGVVTLSNINAPHSYTITGEGKGGAAGFARGSADVFLEEAEGGTLLKYNVEVKVGGKLAQIGSRLIDGTAKKLAEEFFTKFSNLLADDTLSNSTETTEPTVIEEAISETPPDSEKNKGLKPIIWTLGLVIIAALLIFAFAK